MNNVIIIVCGLPGTGKTYFSEHLAKAMDIHVHSTDAIRKKLHMEGAYSERDKEMVYSGLLREMLREVELHNAVILDGTFHRRSTRKRFKRMAASRRYPVYFIEMNADPSVVRERMRTPRADSEADFTVYRRIRAEYEPLERSHLTLHSDRADVGKMVERAKEYIHEQEAN